MDLWDNYQQGNIHLPLKMNRDVPFVDTVFRIMEGAASENDAVALLREAEGENGIQLMKPPIPQLPWLPDEQYESVMQGNFYNFMAQTHLVLDPYQYNDLSLLLPGGYTWEATERGWSRTIADWANQVQWCDYKEWDYVDIYNAPSSYVENFKEWQEVVLRIIEIKCQET